jgi:hypothetical protein
MSTATVDDTDLFNDPGHRPFCWCNNYADAIGVFRWRPNMPVLRFPLDEDA